MNQHKDLLYRQTYATYQLNNRTFSTQNTKISARSLAISYICFQVRIVKEKKGGGGESHTINYYGKSGDSRNPRPPTRALYAKLQREKLHFLSLLTTILKALICWKLESFRGLRPLGPRQGLCPCTPPGALRRAPGPHPYEARASRTHGALRARIFPPTPFFANPGSATVHTPPPGPLLVQVACPQRRRSWGSWGAVAPPPPPMIFFFFFFFWGGGQTYRFAPPPPIISSTWNIF